MPPILPNTLAIADRLPAETASHVPLVLISSLQLKPPGTLHRPHCGFSDQCSVVTTTHDRALIGSFMRTLTEGRHAISVHAFSHESEIFRGPNVHSQPCCASCTSFRNLDTFTDADRPTHAERSWTPATFAWSIEASIDHRRQAEHIERTLLARDNISTTAIVFWPI